MLLDLTVPNVRRGSKVIFLGESGGSVEATEHEPFVGPAGKLLTRIINTGGWTRDMVDLMNVCQRCPDGGYDRDAFNSTFYTEEKTRVGTTEKRKGRIVKTSRPNPELQAWRQLLKEELEQSRPNIVVACGGEALKTMCGITGSISSYRGSILPSTLVPGLKVIPLLHPSYILQSFDWDEVYFSGRIFREKVVPQSKFPELVYRERYNTIDPFSMGEVVDMLRGIETRMDRWVLDLETRAGSIACVGFAWPPSNALIVPIQLTTGPRWFPGDEASFWRALGSLMDHNPNLWGHNIWSFDLDWLLKYGVEPCAVEDTMVMFNRVYPGLPKALQILTMLYTDIPYYKMDSKTWGRTIPNERLHEYCAKDVVGNLWATYPLEEEMKRNANTVWNYNECKNFIGTVLERQQLGFRLDEERNIWCHEKLKEELKSVYNKLADISSDNLVVQPGNKQLSNTIVQKYLYETLGLPIKKKRGKKGKPGSVTADEDALNELFTDFAHVRELQLIMQERHLCKALGYTNMRFKEVA